VFSHEKVWLTDSGSNAARSAAATLAGAVPDRTIDGRSIPWKTVYRTVRRLQARIVKAIQAGRWHKVRALVYLLTHSFSGRALAILRVTENSGAQTAGVDGETWNTPETKTAAFTTLRRHGYQPQPLRRVYIPQSNGKQRPLGTSKVLLAHEVRPLVAHFLQARGLELSHEKTSITHIQDGFDFLGQTIRRYSDGTVLLKPSQPSVQTFLSKIRATLDHSGHQTAGVLILRLNQQIKGWALYHRNASSKRSFAFVDDRIYPMLRSWSRKRHPNKGGKWIKEKYFRTCGHRHWVFSGEVLDKKGNAIPVRLMKAQDVPIRRHVLIRTAVNPYDPTWEGYLETRLRWRMEQTLAGRKTLQRLWRSQEGKCGRCNEALLPERSTWQVHHRTPRSKGGSKDWWNLELVHLHCHRQIHASRSS
jgi:hypothetical protein